MYLGLQKPTPGTLSLHRLSSSSTNFSILLLKLSIVHALVICLLCLFHSSTTLSVSQFLPPKTFLNVTATRTNPLPHYKKLHNLCKNLAHFQNLKLYLLAPYSFLEKGKLRWLKLFCKVYFPAP